MVRNSGTYNTVGDALGCQYGLTEYTEYTNYRPRAPLCSVDFVTTAFTVSTDYTVYRFYRPLCPFVKRGIRDDFHGIYTI